MKFMSDGLLITLEGVRLMPYDDQTGKPIMKWCKGATIGIGHLILKEEWGKYKDGIESDEAIKLMRSDIVPFEKVVSDAIKIPLRQKQFDALVLLCYNIGAPQFNTSSVVKMINGVKGSNYKTLKEAWMAFRLSQGKLNPGLIPRREAEYKLFNGG